MDDDETTIMIASGVIGIYYTSRHQALPIVNSYVEDTP